MSFSNFNILSLLSNCSKGLDKESQLAMYSVVAKVKAAEQNFNINQNLITTHNSNINKVPGYPPTCPKCGSLWLRAEQKLANGTYIKVLRCTQDKGRNHDLWLFDGKWVSRWQKQRRLSASSNENASDNSDNVSENIPLLGGEFDSSLDPLALKRMTQMSEPLLLANSMIQNNNSTSRDISVSVPISNIKNVIIPPSPPPNNYNNSILEHAPSEGKYGKSRLAQILGRRLITCSRCNMRIPPNNNIDFEDSQNITAIPEVSEDGTVQLERRVWYHLHDSHRRLGDALRKYRCGTDKLVIRRSRNGVCIWIGVTGDPNLYTTSTKRWPNPVTHFQKQSQVRLEPNYNFEINSESQCKRLRTTNNAENNIAPVFVQPSSGSIRMFEPPGMNDLKFSPLPAHSRSHNSAEAQALQVAAELFNSASLDWANTSMMSKIASGHEDSSPTTAPSDSSPI